MKKFVASGTEAELTGSSLSALSTNLLAETILPILKKHHLSEIVSNRWYSQQVPLDILYEVKTSGEELLALVAVGQQVIEVIDSAQLPPVETFFEGLSLLSSIYDLNHRNKAANDQIIVTEINPHLIQVTNSTPYPDDLIYGYTHSLARRFAGRNLTPIVQYTDIDKVDGDENMVINVEF